MTPSAVASWLIVAFICVSSAFRATTSVRSSSTTASLAASLARKSSLPSFVSPQRLTMPSAVQTRPSLNTVRASFRSASLVPTPTRRTASCLVHACGLGESSNRLSLS
eukprot:scaffold28188_cov66-Phaeocystis_antarctica.AAC.7